MSTTIEIPGGTAVLRDRAELRVRHRRLIETAGIGAADILARIPGELAASQAGNPGEVEVSALHLSRQEAEVLMELQDATIVALVESWSLPEPIPTMDTIGDLDPAVYDALAQATKATGADVAAETDFGPSPDQADPTGASGRSDGTSSDEAVSSSTTTPEPGGASTPTESCTPA